MLNEADLKEMSRKEHDKDYLFGLNIQTKNRYFPQIAVKNQLIGNNMVVPPNMTNDFVPLLHGTEKREKREIKKKSVSHFKENKFEVPHAGAWFQRRSQPKNQYENNNSSLDDKDPAGFRIPKSYKLT
jgi:hypothetical protein